ncbi:MAG: Rap1a/Tai family immunity protein [Acidobacteriota bacterium]|nr:Rap1a/Tai family immunity protein [Acidobacteriota bacterium]
MTALGLFLALLSTPTITTQPAPSPITSGTRLMEQCQLYFEFLGRTGAGREETFDDDPFGLGYCAGLIRGVAVMAETLMPTRVCLPADTSTANAVWTVIQYLENLEPETLVEPDAELVLRALEDTFRCP